MKRHDRSPPGADFVPASHRRRLSFSHSDLSDPGQVEELFEQCLDQVLRGLHPVSRDTAIRLAAIHCFVQFGEHQKGVEQSIRAYKLLPKEYTHGRSVHSREHEKNIIEQYRNLSFADAFAAKRKYCDICRNLPTYGMIFFEVKEPHGNRLISRLFGVNKDCVMSVDKKTKVVRKLWPMEQIRRWAAGPTTFNIDFGDYQDGYYSVQTTEGGKIKSLLAEFVDVIIWKKKLVDPFGLEGDEGAIMIEDFVLRARSVPVTFEDVVEEEERAPIMSKSHPAALSTPTILEPKERIAFPAESDRFPRPFASPSATLPNEFPRQFDPSALHPHQMPDEAPKLMALPAKAEQYDQLPFQEAAPIATKFTPPTSPFPQQIAPVQLRPNLPDESFSPPFPPLSHSISQLPSPKTRKWQSAVRPPSVSVLTEQEIVYEISVKNGQAHRSFEQFYSQKRNLQGLNAAIGQSARRVSESSGQLAKGQQQIANLALTEEQRLMAVQLGEDTIRHRAVLFLAYTAQLISRTFPFDGRRMDFGFPITPTIWRGSNCRGGGSGQFVRIGAVFPRIVRPPNGRNANGPTRSLNLHGFYRLDDKIKSRKILIGENAFALLNALNDAEEAEEEHRFYEEMNQAIQQVANGTANLVVQAKSLPALSVDLRGDKVIESATNVALFTSELIALARVLSSIMAHPACQKRVQNAVERVRSAIHELIEHAKADAFSQFAVTGTTEHYAKMQQNALVAEVALKQLLEQTMA
ncbi:hypothetical protein niasHT_013502 [Heterodera trifolii]|uniref:FERM domain-containing protein n=1 Tax=Heterodera trifolii TaxID=157864 RepID=A0ABD2LDR3_9BILA